MDPYEFQKLVADLLKAMGYYPSWVAPPGKDGGLDIVAYPDPLGTRPPRIKVQVKRQQQRINADGVRAFVSLVNEDDAGLFVAIGGFTRDAEDFARMQERRKITLIDLERLVALWTEFYPTLTDLARERLPLIFLPDYTNRETAARIFARQFNVLLDKTGLKHDPITNTQRSVYCLRHTAICMRIILSHGKVNIFNLAKNAGTSVEQIERFYARNLPLSAEMAKNLQSFGEE